jgi:hypothetical protein
MSFTKISVYILSKNVSAHDRAHDLHALMSGSIFELTHERFFL